MRIVERLVLAVISAVSTMAAFADDPAPVDHSKAVQAAENAYRKALVDGVLAPLRFLAEKERAEQRAWIEALCTPDGPFTPLEVAWGLYYGVSAITVPENSEGYDTVVSNIVRLAVRTYTRSRPARPELSSVGPRWMYEVKGLSRQYSAFNGRVVGPFDNAEDERICREAEEEYLRRQQEWIENAGAYKQHRETVLRLTRTLHPFAGRLPPALRAKLLRELRSRSDDQTDFIEIFGLAEFVETEHGAADARDG